MRKREQFLKHGISHLPPHEALEILLYYAIPRGDTNKIAHTLIKRFGSFVNVLNADYDELLKVSGVGKNAASLICYMQMISRLYAEKQAHQEMESLNTSNNLKKYCFALFLGAKEEEVRCLYLSDDLKLINHELVSVGKIGVVGIPVRKITRSIFEKNCSKFVIAHNHPAGTCLPSRTDVDSTKEITDLFKRIDIELVDHIIVGRDGALSMRESNFL
jgi:DNA repair protein RadC